MTPVNNTRWKRTRFMMRDLQSSSQFNRSTKGIFVRYFRSPLCYRYLTPLTQDIFKVPNEFSPNWLWMRLGFSIHREGLRRSIFDTNGHKVCERAMHNIEQSIAAWLYFGAVLSPETKGSLLHKEYLKSIN